MEDTTKPAPTTQQIVVTVADVASKFPTVEAALVSGTSRKLLLHKQMVVASGDKLAVTLDLNLDALGAVAMER